jgi:hypothetical protein
MTLEEALEFYEGIHTDLEEMILLIKGDIKRRDE